MANIHEKMQAILAEHRKANPEQSYRFLDSTPDILRDRIAVDGWNVVKSKDAAAGTVGEVRVGDLILGSRPRKEDEEERKSDREKAAAQLQAPMNRYYSELEKLGAGGKYLRPLTPGDLERDKGGWKGK